MSKTIYYEYDEYYDRYTEYEVDDKEYPVDFECEYDNSDVWDAVTDGMYGDYPGGDIDLDQFGF